MEPFKSLQHATLSAYYPRLLTLRDYLKCRIPTNQWERVVLENDDAAYRKLLEDTIVAIRREEDETRSRAGDWPLQDVRMTQQEAIDQILIAIFKMRKFNDPRNPQAPSNVLAAGFKHAGMTNQGPNFDRVGIDSVHVNSQVTMIRTSSSFQLLHTRLGSTPFITLLTSTSLFLPLPNRCYSQLCGRPMYTIRTIAELEDVEKKRKRKAEKGEGRVGRGKKRRLMESENMGDLEGLGGCDNVLSRDADVLPRNAGKSPTEVKIPRQRMFYGNWNYRGGRRTACCGLPSNHILNNIETLPPRIDPSLTSSSSPGFDHHAEGRTLLRYIFPRQHGLHNVFTCDPTDGLNRKEKWGKAGIARDYTTRKEEIELAIINNKAKTPNRLKRETMSIVEEIIARHRKTDYWKLRSLHCPSKRTRAAKQIKQLAVKEEFQAKHLHAVELSAGDRTLVQDPRQGVAVMEGKAEEQPEYVVWQCTQGEVSRYVKAVCNAILPDELWGSQENKQLIYRSLDSFIRQCRFETFSIHQTLQGFRYNDVPWLKAGCASQRVPPSEEIKRRELMQELIYWMYDSLLVPLLKNTFFITETAVTKYRTTYFRHDDWHLLCKPVLLELGSTLYRKADPGRQRGLQRLKAPHATLRLLPKANGVRPIANLGRRQRKVQSNGDVWYDKSINELLTGAFHVLDYEKRRHDDLLAASLFGLYDIYGRIKKFKKNLMQIYGELPKLYFVKTDVKKAFDTINQKKLLEVLREILDRPTDYTSGRHAQLLPTSSRAPKLWKWLTQAKDAALPFHEMVTQEAAKLQNAIFVDLVREDVQNRETVMTELRKHITSSVVKFGASYYDQITGIPQGSKVSSLLCSYFYGHMEKERLSFTRAPDSLLLRIIDDFLFITADQSKAQRFLKRMTKGQEDYGCRTAPEKTVVNFKVNDIDALQTSHCSDTEFPYCGLLVDTSSLDLRIDITRSYNLHVRESLTVKSTMRQGHSFAGWFKRILENHNHIIYNDTGLNSYEVVCSNIYTNFLLGGTKLMTYLRALKYGPDDRSDWVYRAINDVIKQIDNASHGHLHSCIGKQNNAERSVSSEVFRWLARHAICRLLAMRPTLFLPVQQALQEDLDGVRHNRRLKRRLEQVTESAWERVRPVPF